MKVAKTFLTIALSGLLSSTVFASDFLSRVAETLPGGIVEDSEAEQGFFSKQWSGLTKIVSDGQSGLLLPAYTIHPAYAYPNRRQENGYTWGGGISRNIIDSRGNRRIVYAMAFSDSHNNIEPFMGYAWLSRWKMGSLPTYFEAGYTLGLTFRGDYRWLPIPAPLPLVGFGTDNLGVYGTYVPGADIFFFFANLTFDDRKHRSAPPPSTSNFGNKVLLYAGGGWQKTDMNGIGGVTITSDSALNAGIRYFITKEWALDFSVNSSKHDLKNYGKKFGKYKLTSYNLAAQYHFYPAESFSIYAGLGVGYFRADKFQMDPRWTMRRNTFSPIIQAGATWALSKHVHLTGGMDLGFPRFRSSNSDRSSFSMRPSPVTFKLDLGIAF